MFQGETRRTQAYWRGDWLRKCSATISCCFYCVLLSQCRVDAVMAICKIGSFFGGFRRSVCVADSAGKCSVIVSTERNATIPEINTAWLSRGPRRPRGLVGVAGRKSGPFTRPPKPQEIGGSGGVNLLTIRRWGESVEMTQPLTGAGTTDCGGVVC